MKVGPFENVNEQIALLGPKHYDDQAIGGTTNIVLDRRSKKVMKEYLSLSGTMQNCAGGVTPWGTWLSCEEYVNNKGASQVPHGYVFEVDPRKSSLTYPRPLKKVWEGLTMKLLRLIILIMHTSQKIEAMVLFISLCLKSQII